MTISSIDVTGVGRGEFTLDNDGDEPVAAQVAEAWLELDGERQRLADFSLFDLDRDEPIEGDEVAVEGGATLHFALGFPRIPVVGSPGAVAVVARLTAGDDELEAASTVRIERRLPAEADDNVA